MLFGGQSRSYQSVNYHQNLLKFCYSKKKDMYLLSGVPKTGLRVLQNLIRLLFDKKQLF